MRILNLDPADYSPKARAVLESVGRVEDGPLDRDALKAAIGRYDALILRFAHRIDADLLGGAERLKVIGTNVTGLDHIDLDACARRDVRVVSLKGEYEFLRGIWATAEHTWALLLALTRRLPEAARSVERLEWTRERFMGHELAGKNLGIVGLGRIGEKVAAYGRAFAMDVHGFDPDPRARARVPWATWHDDLDGLLRAADVISLHVPLETATTGLIGARELALMKPGALLINTARGAVIDEDALAEALENGRLGGAALDVLRGEDRPGFPANNRLARLAAGRDALLITPHIGGATWESWEKTELFVARKVAALLHAGT